MDKTEMKQETPLYFRIAWLLLLALGAFFVFASCSDLAADFSAGIPSDHRSTFFKLAGVAWTSAKQTSPGTTKYVTLLEYGYAVHELVFALLFLAILAIPFRRGERWAWWTCWVVLVASVVYSLSFGRYDPTLLRQSLIGDIALPVLLLAQIKRFFFRRQTLGIAP